MLKTLRLSPFGLAGVGFSLPGTAPVRKSAAWVEFSKNVNAKWVVAPLVGKAYKRN